MAGPLAEAGLVDAETADRIRAYEQAQAGTMRLRWPILIALAFGGLMVCGGVLLFVAAHWDALSPPLRFALVIGMVCGFHVAAALTADRFPGLATTLHTIGTVALGGGIALAGQIFNLEEHWPSGILLWAIGAAAGWFVLRQIPQLALLALLTPAWLVSEWMVATLASGSSRLRHGWPHVACSCVRWRMSPASEARDPKRRGAPCSG